MVSTVPESINGGLNCKINQKAWYWDNAAFFQEKERRRCFDSGAKVVCVLCRAGACLYG